MDRYNLPSWLLHRMKSIADRHIQVYKMKMRRLQEERREELKYWPYTKLHRPSADQEGED
jgi:hypothetical protein